MRCHARKQDRRRKGCSAPGTSYANVDRAARLVIRAWPRHGRGPSATVKLRGRKHPTAGPLLASAVLPLVPHWAAQNALREKRNMWTAPGCFEISRTSKYLRGIAIAAAGSPGRGNGAAPWAAPRPGRLFDVHLAKDRSGHGQRRVGSRASACKGWCGSRRGRGPSAHSHPHILCPQRSLAPPTNSAGGRI